MGPAAMDAVIVTANILINMKYMFVMIICYVIMVNDSFIINTIFKRLPSGSRYRLLVCRTNRLKDSFSPWALRLLIVQAAKRGSDL